MVVVADGLPVNPPTLTALREPTAQAGYLQAGDVAEHEVVDVEELHMVEALQELRDEGLLDD